ncbi:MAG: FG-GAP-like repeat-containing protein, partial [Bacteroidota bacterium]
DGFWQMVNYGFHHQYMYNALQTAQGVRADGTPFYAETAKLSGLDKTDWSWACLFADYDHDGYKDLFVTNGTRRDINNKDYFNWLERVDISLKVKLKELSVQDLTDRMPFKRVDNPIFQNQKGRRFQRINDQWGLNFEGFSNGAAYADLDNDGDLELIVNNIDSAACIFRNLTTETRDQHYLKVKLKGPQTNIEGLGAKLTFFYQGHQQFVDHTRVRGYQSAVGASIHVGLGSHSVVDRILVNWPDGKVQWLQNIDADQTLMINYAKAQAPDEPPRSQPTLFSAHSLNEDPSLLHQENPFDDFAREVLLPHRMSGLGPALAVGDVNQDGNDDLFLGGAKDRPGRLVLTQADSPYIQEIMPLAGKAHEDVDATFFDLNGDGFLDLYVVSGGNEEAEGDPSYQDRIYQNDGTGHFTWIPEALPNHLVSGSTVKEVDLDLDGDLDLLVGGRQSPGAYPLPADSRLLENISEAGQIRFRDITQTHAPELLGIGMLTDALWDDYDQDGDVDLVVVGEWMTPTVLENHQGHLKKRDEWIGPSVGWWNTLVKADFDRDGDQDYVLGNLGLNYKYQASKEATFDIYAGDMDENGQLDIILGFDEHGVQFPVRGKQCSSQQIPKLGERYMSYNAFAKASLQQIYSVAFLDASLHYQANEFAHLYLENLGNGDFRPRQLPLSTQISSINAIEVMDVNRDGNMDMILAGNNFQSEVETPRNDAGFGWVLLGDGQGGFVQAPFAETGLFVPYETRHLRRASIGEQTLMIFANNNAPASVFAWKDRRQVPQ